MERLRAAVSKKENIGILLAEIIILTASFDIVAAIDIGGVTIRLAQFVILIGTCYLFTKGRIALPIGYKWLLLWLILQAASIWNAPNCMYAVGYFFWLVLNVMVVIMLQNFFNTGYRADVLIRFFVKSFFVMSLLGLFQWLCKIMGINFFLTQETLNASNLPRLNGFTYEPSYYSTYLLPGWIITVYLFEEGSKLFTKAELQLYAVVISLALLLSTSRMGWLFMGLWLFYRAMVYLKSFLRGKITRSRLVIMGAAAVVALCAAVLIQRNSIDVFVGGLGIHGTSAHSSNARIMQFVNTLKLVQMNPLFGYSLGGVAAEYCQTYGLPFDSGVATCVWAELLVASGLVGMIPFIVWFGNLLVMPLSKAITLDRQRECTALFYALVWECGILAMNQNILRIYFWVLLGVINAAIVRYKNPGNYLECT